MLKYLHQNGCSWDKDACKCAAKNGHLEVLQYLHENGCPWDEQEYLQVAKSFGHLNVVKWFTTVRSDGRKNRKCDRIDDQENEKASKKRRV